MRQARSAAKKLSLKYTDQLKKQATRLKHLPLLKLLQRIPKTYITLGGWLILSAVSAYLLYRRYPFNYTHPNFYSEDGAVFVYSVINDGFLKPLLYLFNGYLIFLHYFLIDVAMVINSLAGGSFATIPKAMAVVSYMTIGAACALPWLLFRHRLGNLWALVLVAVLTLMPLGMADFAILGTIGNLKFLLFYVGALLAFYRCDQELCPPNSLRVYAIDTILLLCIWTNVLIAVFLPFILFCHRKELLAVIKSRSIVPLTRGLLSIVLLGIIVAAYVAVIYLLGIPKIPGYLEGTFEKEGFLGILFRSSWYGFLYPAYTLMSFTVVKLILLLSLAVFLFKKHRFIALFVMVGIVVSCLGFAVNRPGVTGLYLYFANHGGPGQFFYGGMMLFMFGVFYVAAGWVNQLRLRAKMLGFAVFGIYLVWATPYAGYERHSYDLYGYRPVLVDAVRDACKQPGRVREVEIYPSADWTMIMPEDACKPADK